MCGGLESAGGAVEVLEMLAMSHGDGWEGTRTYVGEERGDDGGSYGGAEGCRVEGHGAEER